MIYRFISSMCYIGIGLLMVSIGYGPSTWQYWVVFIILFLNGLSVAMYD